ncbi:hypothetical protein EUZ85_12215 [Hahella sp. KA22]|uniref:hypothetical protein n=1 Tax=Hahella sp. KA22 TaxID=1628392 RepID=UPI000FDE8F6D|nr:hypothetical protein [Hahella sp. KA22]AZZ91457.1 hypothetical protein ENC22_09655 [Hahella sp. KA22]QAY54826.1 hypothetical protein EUZ85_12215 [Hahella sp. KA22]
MTNIHGVSSANQVQPTQQPNSTNPSSSLNHASPSNDSGRLGGSDLGGGSSSHPTASSNGRAYLASSTEGAQTYYGQAVNGVNSFLQQNGVPLPNDQAHSIANNVSEHERGTLSQGEAHMREARMFAGSAVQYAAQGDFKNAAINGVGAVANTLGAGIVATVTDQSDAGKKLEELNNAVSGTF